MERRNILYEYISRVEGEGSLRVSISGEKAVEARFEVFEAPRFFEAFVRGRSALEMPELTSRICGICPIAHVITAARAVENALALVVDERAVALRKALALSGIMQSHVLHMYFLAAPDFLGYSSAISAYNDLKDVVLRGMRLKRTANLVSEYIGGRAVHPVTVVVGGLSKSPPRENLSNILSSLDSALGDAQETVKLVSKFRYPDFETDHIDVALHSEREYPINEGTICTSSGSSFAERFYRENVYEEQAAHSNTKRSRLRDGGKPFAVGPISRFNLNYNSLCDRAKEAAEIAGIKPPVRNPFKSTVVRAVEVVQAVEEMRQILRGGVVVPPPREARLRQGVGAAATEAPRGLLYHYYAFDRDGKVSNCDIVTPTAHNSLRIEEDVYELTPSVVSASDEELKKLFGMLVRAYDPCISCSVHAMRIEVHRSS